MSFSQGLTAGFNVMASAKKRSEEQRMQQELQDVGKAKAETSQGFTADQGREIERLSGSGDYDVGFDDGGSYVFTPKAGGEAVRVAQQGVTDFLGNRTAGTMSQDQVESARSMAMAGILKQHDPVAGTRMERDIRQGQREDQRFGWEQGDRARVEKERAQEDEYKAGRQSILSQSPFAKADAEYGAAMKDYQAQMDAYNQRVEAGDHTAAKPQPPQKASMTPGQMASTYAQLIEHDAKFGKLNTEGFMSFGKQLQQLQDEGYTKALKAAHAGQSLDKVAELFNAGGSTKFDPKTVTSDKVVKDASGVPSRIIQYKDPSTGQLNTINVTAELDMLGQADKVYARTYQANADRRAGAAEGRANAAEARSAEQFRDGASQRQAAKSEADLRVELAGIDDSTQEGQRRSEQIQAKLLALKTGTRGAMAGHDPADVVKAKKLHAEGRYGSEAEALDAVITKPDKMFQEFQKAAAKDSMDPDKANETAGKMMEANGWTRNQSGTWRRSGVPSAPVAEFGSPADAEAAAKSGKLKPGDKVKIGGRTATYQP